MKQECKSPKLLVVGGLTDQTYLMKKAKEEGYYVVLCATAPCAAALELADKYYAVDHTDGESVLSAAMSENIQGVISNSDAAMLTVSYVAERLGLVGNTVDAVARFRSKAAFRDLQHQLQCYAPKYIMTDTFSDLIRRAGSMTYPAILKPCDGNGSNGVTVIKNAAQLVESEDAWKECESAASRGEVMLEQYVDMPSLEVIEGDVFVLGETILWDGLFSTRRSESAKEFPMTYTFPAVLSEEDLKEVKETLLALLRADGITFGELNVELYFTERHELFCIEINPRQGGLGIPFMIRQHCGIDMTRLLVTTAMGDNSYFDEVCARPRECRLVTRQVVHCHEDGIYRGVYISEEIAPFVKRVKEFYHPNEQYLSRMTRVSRQIPRTSWVMPYDVVAFVDLAFEDRENQLYFTEHMEEHVKPVVKVG